MKEQNVKPNELLAIERVEGELGLDLLKELNRKDVPR